MSLSIFSETLKQITLPSFYGGAYEPPARKRMEMADAEREAIVIDAIKRVGYPLTRKEICAETGMTIAIAQRILQNMTVAEKLVRHGVRHTSRWGVA